MPEMIKRTWCWAGKPREFGIKCPNCGDCNTEWSEYAGEIWCYECELDLMPAGSVVDGPVGIGLLQTMGINLNRIDITSGKILVLTMEEDGSITWKEEGDVGSDHPE